MGFQKIGGGSPLQAPPFPITLAAGQTFGLPVGQGGGGTFGGAQFPQIGMGNAFSGQYIVNLGTVSELQVYDPSGMIWKTAAHGSATVSADGKNFRIANTSGSPTGATITTAGSGYTNGFYGYKEGQAIQMVAGTQSSPPSLTVTASDGSTWNVIVGGSVNSTLSVAGTVFASSGGSLAPFGTTLNGMTASGGSGYTRPPMILFGPPPNQGQQPFVLPQATCTVAAGAVATVTVTNQGAGLLGLPSITVVPAAGDVSAGGAVIGWLAANNAEVGNGTVRAMALSNYGPAPPGASPTLTIAGGGGTGAAVTMTVNATAATNDTVTLVSL
jgi:hypothetical protein